jgi:hypothetical protein
MYPIYHELASRLGLTMVPADPGIMTFTIDLRGELEGRPVHIHRYVGGGGHAVVRAYFRPPLGMGLEIVRASILDRVGELVGLHDLEIGDPDFDRAFRVKARAPERVHEFLRADVRRALLALGDARLADDRVESYVGKDDESVELLAGIARDAVRLGALLRP